MGKGQLCAPGNIGRPEINGCENRPGYNSVQGAMKKVCVLRPYEAKAWEEEGTLPNCRNHFHVPIRVARAWLHPWQSLNNDTYQATVRVIPGKNWVVLLSSRTFRIVGQTQMGNRHGKLPSGPGCPGYQLVKGG